MSKCTSIAINSRLDLLGPPVASQVDHDITRMQRHGWARPETPAGHTGPQIGLGDRGKDPAGAQPLEVRHTSRMVYQGCERR